MWTSESFLHRIPVKWRDGWLGQDSPVGKRAERHVCFRLVACYSHEATRLTAQQQHHPFMICTIPCLVPLRLTGPLAPRHPITLISASTHTSRANRPQRESNRKQAKSVKANIQSKSSAPPVPVVFFGIHPTSLQRIPLKV